VPVRKAKTKTDTTKSSMVYELDKSEGGRKRTDQGLEDSEEGQDKSATVERGAGKTPEKGTPDSTRPGKRPIKKTPKMESYT